MKKCFKCDSEMEGDAVYCPNCGEAVTEPEVGGEAVTEPEASDEEVAEPEANGEEVTEPEVSDEEVAEPEANGEAVTEPEVSGEEVTEPEASDEEVTEPEVIEAVQVEESVPAVEPSPVQNPGKSGNGRKTVLVAGVIAAVAVIGVAAATMLLPAKKDPKDVVIDAFKSVYASEQVMPIDEIFGLTDMNKYARTENIENNMTLKLESISDPSLEMLEGSGIEVNTKRDIKNKDFLAMIGIQYQNMDLVHANTYLDETHLMLSVPELSKKVFSLNYAEDLEGQIAQSPYLGKEMINSGIDISVFDDYMKYAMSFYNDEENKPIDIAGVWEHYKESSNAIEEFKAAMTVEKGEKATKVVNGKEVECQGYDAVITKEASIQYLRTSFDFFLEDETLKKDVVEYLTQMIRFSEGMGGYNSFGMNAEEAQEEAWGEAKDSIDQFMVELEKMMGDVTMTVYVDKSGRMASLNATTELVNEEGDTVTVNLDADLKGGSYLTQNADLVLTFSGQDEKTIEITMSKEGTYDKKTLTSDIQLTAEMDEEKMNITYNGFYQISDGSYDMKLGFDYDGDEGYISMNGFVTDLEKGKSMDVTADAMEVFYDGEKLAELSGSYVFKPLEGEVTVPEGEVMDILAATEKEWEDVQAEIMAGVFLFYSKFQ